MFEKLTKTYTAIRNWYFCNNTYEKIIVPSDKLLWRRRELKNDYYNFLIDKRQEECEIANKKAAEEYEIAFKKWKAEQLEKRYRIMPRLHGWCIIDTFKDEILNVNPAGYDGRRKFNFVKRATAEEFLYSIKAKYARTLDREYTN